MNPDQALRRFLERQLGSFEKFRFRTNDILSLAWHQPTRVNGKSITLGSHAFSVLLLLAARAIESPGDFFETDAIVGAIQRNRRLLGEFHLSWDSPTASQVHTAVYDLRRALRNKGLTPSLIESARPRSRGYRLSLPAMNIITDPRSAANIDRLALDPFAGNGTALLAPAGIFSRQ